MTSLAARHMTVKGLCHTSAFTLRAVIEVKKMQLVKKGHIGQLLLRLLRGNSSLEPINHQETVVRASHDDHYAYSKEMATWRQAEQGKAKTLNVQAYILANQRMHEIDATKAMAVSMSHHEKWKAGGPC